MSTKWVPLEASPDVFNEWSRSLGLPETSLSFQDLFSLDEEFLAFVPKPVKAVLLLFPSRGRLADSRTEEEQKDGGKWQGKGVWWCKQTISNACGSMGLLHALMNLPEEGAYSIPQNSPLKQFKTQSLPLSPIDRAKLLEDSDFFTKAHNAVIQAGQSSIPEDLDVETHFIAFIEAINDKGEKRVVEMDGARSGPFDRGACTDLLKDTAKIVQEKYIAKSDGDIEFNMMVLAGEEA